jgi:hypothetical protein
MLRFETGAFKIQVRSFPFERLSESYDVQPDAHMMDAYGVFGHGSQFITTKSTAKGSITGLIFMTFYHRQ